jgi:hypothetical protein
MVLSVHAGDTMASPLSDSRVLPHPRHVSESLRKPLRLMGFWTAVALPFLHIPLLLTGLDGAAEMGAFLALFALNVVALVLGHGYGDD